MQVIPAIDLKDHQVVRLAQGKMDQVTVYADNPLAQAEEWINCGATRLHLVDLNGAFEGKPIHFEEVTAISKAYPQVRIEIGGGIRNLDTIKRYFDCGVHYCILGTAAIKDPTLLEKSANQFPSRIILGVDARDGCVATEGWDDVSSIPAIDLVKRFASFDLAEVIYTDISKDGMMRGMNIPATQEMAEQSPFPVIASGGLTKISEINELQKIANVSGVIAGKAIYKGSIDLKEAIALTL